MLLANPLKSRDFSPLRGSLSGVWKLANGLPGHLPASTPQALRSTAGAERSGKRLGQQIIHTPKPVTNVVTAFELTYNTQYIQPIRYTKYTSGGIDIHGPISIYASITGTCRWGFHSRLFRFHPG